MRKYFLLMIFLIWSILAVCASAADAPPAVFEMPDMGVAGQKIQLKVQTSEPLPASSFYRVELECPKKPENAAIATEMGYPQSDVVFNTPGRYECIAQLGIITRSSCASARYKSLGEFNFSIEIKPD